MKKHCKKGGKTRSRNSLASRSATKQIRYFLCLVGNKRWRENEEHATNQSSENVGIYLGNVVMKLMFDFLGG